MSIFYNLSKSADRDEEEELRFDSDEGNELLIDKQSDYQVGVVRFKIPMAKVPLFRVYRDDLHLNILGGNLGANNINTAYYRRDNFFGNDGYETATETYTGKILPPTPNNIHTNSGLYGADSLKDNGKSFVDLYSHTQFTELLNNALSKAIVNNEVNRVRQLPIINSYCLGETNDINALESAGARANAITLNQHINVLSFTAGQNGLGVNLGGVDNTQNIVVPKSNINPSTNGFILTDFNLTIRTFNQIPLTNNIADLNKRKTNGQNGYIGANFKHLRFYLVKGLAVSGAVMPNDIEYYPIATNILDGYDGINPNVSTRQDAYRISLSLRPGHNIDAQSQKDTDLFFTNLARQGLKFSPFRMYPSSTDFTGLYGQRIDKCDNKVPVAPNTLPYQSEKQVWSIMIVNDTYAPTYADGPVGSIYQIPY